MRTLSGISRLFLLLIFLSTLISCRKDKNQISVSGNLTDPNTGVVVEGAEVVFSAKKISSGVYNAGFEVIASATTDANGNFSFEMEEEFVSEYRLSASKNGYFSNIMDIPGPDIKAGVPFTADLELFPVGYIILMTRNFAPYDSTDFISYSFTSGYLNCYECCDNAARYGQGEAYTDTFKCKTYGNQNVIITWNVTKNNITTLHNTTLYCKAFDTVSFQINY